jgi:hypothetical protein
MRYTLRNSSPSDPGIITNDGGFILAGSRADAERIVYDNQQLWENSELCLDTAVAAIHMNRANTSGGVPS